MPSSVEVSAPHTEFQTLPALVASTFSKATAAYYAIRLEGRQREPGIKTKMRVKLAAKLLVIAWTIMKTQQPFDEDRLQGISTPVRTG